MACLSPNLLAMSLTLRSSGLLESKSSGASSLSPGLRRTKTAVMLSPPRPLVSRKSCETQASSSSSRASSIARSSQPAARRARMKSTTCWLLFTSQTPSQQMIRNSSLSGSRSLKVTSGVEQIICFSGGRDRSFLYSRSPRARDRFRLPLTRYCPGPQHSTRPPAASMRCFSVGALGLWSSLKGIACPALQSTARLSPALAVTICRSVTQHTQAVQPTMCASPLRGDGITRSRV
mmetsp:Transcript_11855/g.28019  ORF Transcript_11855/g.28019 Transcript_11855/m.28019 type:complete len:234 (-) Transcript_11855:411-1112(-)